MRQTCSVRHDACALVITKPRVRELFDVEQVKQFIRIDFNDDDNLIKHLIQAATNHVEHYLGRTLLKQSYKQIWQYRHDDPDQCLDYFVVPIHMGPVMRIDKVTDRDRKEDLKRVSWDLDMPRPVLMFARFHERVAIEYTAGYGETPECVPPEIRQAVLTIIAELYRNRDNLNPSQFDQYIKGVLQCYVPKRLV